MDPQNQWSPRRFRDGTQCRNALLSRNGPSSHRPPEVEQKSPALHAQLRDALSLASNGLNYPRKIRIVGVLLQLNGDLPYHVLDEEAVGLA
jgi:hypothetical protein